VAFLEVLAIGTYIEMVRDSASMALN